MELSRHHSYAVLENQKNPFLHSFRIVSNLSDVIHNWQPSTRVSPVFGVEEFSTAVHKDLLFEGNSHLIFLGPVHPEKLFECCSVNCKIWLTLGIFNAIILPPDEGANNAILEWCEANNICYEYWGISDGYVNNKAFSLQKGTDNGWRNILTDISKTDVKAELNDSHDEFLPLMASTISRAEQYVPRLVTDLSEVSLSISEGYHLCNLDKSTPAYEFAGIMTSINAALSRFSSQTFSGTTPITETECHFWSHSLFGVGIATLGLWRINNFIHETLGEQRIAEKFVKLGDKECTFPDLCDIRDYNDFWHEDHLRNVNIPPEDQEPIIPLIPYFSGRDGYKSTLNTISAPLAIISSCNSINWNLLTITHEISHTVIKVILSELYPDLNSPNDIDNALSLLRKEIVNNKLLSKIKQLLYFAICAMDYAETKNDFIPDNHQEFSQLLDKWHHEVEEIMVSTFDFLYFYGKKSEQYIQGIWSSWSVIPNISNRVHEYVIRTICAIMSTHLRRYDDASGAEYDSKEYARDQVIIHLSSLKAKRVKEKKPTSPYIDEALNYLTEHWDDEIKDRVMARKDIVKIVKAFLYSETIESKLKSESKLVSTDSAHGKHTEGYSLKQCFIDSTKIDNPLRFLELYTKGTSALRADSAWMFYTLAFNIENR
jgi:hypothetical protein